MEKKFWADLHMHSCFTKDFTGTEGKFFPCNNASREWEGLWTVMTNHLRLLETEGFPSIQDLQRKHQDRLRQTGMAGHPLWTSHSIDKFSWRRGLFQSIFFSSKDFFVSYYFMFCFFILISTLWSKPRTQSCEKIPHWNKVLPAPKFWECVLGRKFGILSEFLPFLTCASPEEADIFPWKM